jgi:HPr kinase/phosphorylase
MNSTDSSCCHLRTSRGLFQRMSEGAPTIAPTIHASAVLVGAKAVLIRGPSGSGKSQLALTLLQAAQAGHLRFARLVADDRVHVEAVNGRLLVRAASALKGLLELRGSGIQSIKPEPVAAIGYVVDLAAEDAARLPERQAQEEAVIEGIRLPRLAVASGQEALPLLLALLHSPAGGHPGAVQPP